jgi:hypothetical protein
MQEVEPVRSQEGNMETLLVALLLWLLSNILIIKFFQNISADKEEHEQA